MKWRLSLRWGVPFKGTICPNNLDLNYPGHTFSESIPYLEETLVNLK